MKDITKGPDVDPAIEQLKMAREMRREHWRQEYDTGFFFPKGISRRDFVDTQLRKEGLL